MKRVLQFVTAVQWLPVLALMLVVAAIIMAVLHEPDTALILVIGSLTLAQLTRKAPDARTD